MATIYCYIGKKKSLSMLLCVSVCVCIYIIFKKKYEIEGFPGDSMVKNPHADAGDVDLIPRLGRSPGEGSGNPFQYSCLGNPMDRGAL